MKRSLFILIATQILIAGCAYDEAHRYYADERYPARDPEQVEILHSKPDRPHVIIADLQARGASAEYMRKEAAKIGGDAVIVSFYGGYRARSDEWAGQDAQKHTYSRITGTVLKYRSE